MSNNNNNLNKKKMIRAYERGLMGTMDFNCWGATLFVLDVVDELYWCPDFEMDEFLEKNTIEVKRVAVGDILVIRNSFGLEHTAVYIGDKMYFHKRGMNTSEITTRRGIRMIYKGNIVEVRRVKSE